MIRPLLLEAAIVLLGLRAPVAEAQSAPSAQGQGAPAIQAKDAIRDKDEDAILKQVDVHYNHLASLRTQFTERYTGLGIDRTETGRLLLKKPGRMRWDYTTPAGKLFVLDGKYAWSYTPGDAQVGRMPAKRVDDLRSPLRFLLGHTQLKKELDRLSITPEPGGYRIAGIPKGLGERVKELVLDTSADGRITKIRLEELDGASTEFTFDRSEENIAIPESEFRYSPPAGVAVAEGLPPV